MTHIIPSCPICHEVMTPDYVEKPSPVGQFGKTMKVKELTGYSCKRDHSNITQPCDECGAPVRVNAISPSACYCGEVCANRGYYNGRG